MSKKKYKKRHSQDVMDAKRQANQARLADDRARNSKRMDPMARNLLWGNLVFLAIAQLLYSNGMISDAISAGCTILGIILLFVALWLQFGKKKDSNSQPRSGNWPGLR